MHTRLNPDQQEITLNLLRKTLLSIDPIYKIQNEYTQKIYDRGKLEGATLATLDVLLRQLETRFGELSRSDLSRLDRAVFIDPYGITNRVLTAKTLDEALSPR
jgi:hypothetical protein